MYGTWSWVPIAALIPVGLAALALWQRQRPATPQAAVAATATADRARVSRLTLEFAHYREELEFVRERLRSFLADPSGAPDVELGDWLRRADAFKAVLGVTSEEYHVLTAAYRGVTAIGQGLDPERVEPVLFMVEGALEAVQAALDKLEQI